MKKALGFDKKKEVLIIAPPAGELHVRGKMAYANVTAVCGMGRTATSGPGRKENGSWPNRTW